MDHDVEEAADDETEKRNDRQFDGRLAGLRSEDGRPKGKSQHDEKNDEKVNDNGSYQRSNGFSAVLFTPRGQRYGAHAGSVLLIRA